MKMLFDRWCSTSFVLCVIALLLVAGLSQTASATTVTAWTTTTLNLREGPTVHAYKIGTLPKHKRLQLVKCKYDYYGRATWCKAHVDYTWGWVSARHLTTHKPARINAFIPRTSRTKHINQYSAY